MDLGTTKDNKNHWGSFGQGFYHLVNKRGEIVQLVKKQQRAIFGQYMKGRGMRSIASDTGVSRPDIVEYLTSLGYWVLGRDAGEPDGIGQSGKDRHDSVTPAEACALMRRWGRPERMNQCDQ